MCGLLAGVCARGEHAHEEVVAGFFCNACAGATSGGRSLLKALAGARGVAAPPVCPPESILHPSERLYAKMHFSARHSS